MSISKNKPYKKEKLSGRTRKSALQTTEEYMAGYVQWKKEKDAKKAQAKAQEQSK